jgi:uncharacterized OB-fold protein
LTQRGEATDGIRPAPDRDSAEWWRAVARHEFAVQACDRCGTLRFPARAYCHHCRSGEWRWREISPTGRVESWIVNHQRFLPGFTPPYTVVMVRLEDAPDCVMYGGWSAGREPCPGERVEASFRSVDDELSLIDWGPA